MLRSLVPSAALRSPLRPTLCIMSRDITTFRANCRNCKQTFAHPSLGDFGYGEAILCSVDGKHYATVSAFSEFPQRVRDFMRSTSSNFWAVLASLADSIDGKGYSPNIHCPFCSSNDIEFWEGERIGVTSVPEALFVGASALPEHDLKILVAKIGQGVSNA